MIINDSDCILQVIPSMLVASSVQCILLRDQDFNGRYDDPLELLAFPDPTVIDYVK